MTTTVLRALLRIPQGVGYLGVYERLLRRPREILPRLRADKRLSAKNIIKMFTVHVIKTQTIPRAKN